MHKWPKSDAPEQRCAKCGMRRTREAFGKGKERWGYWHGGNTDPHPLAGACEARDSKTLVSSPAATHDGFPCCGGSDEHPPEHTQDCPDRR